MTRAGWLFAACLAAGCMGAGEGDPDGDVGANAQGLTRCGLLLCRDGEVCCNFACVNPLTDENNCGACGAVCDGTCDRGLCMCEGALCDGPGSRCCPGQGGCIDSSTDENNCGGCGIRCGSGEQCLGGQCTCRGPGFSFEQCGTSETCCPGNGCTDVLRDTSSCGACGATCGDGEVCSFGRCQCGSRRATSVGATVCSASAGQACCDGACRPRSACACGTTTCGTSERCCPVTSSELQCVDVDRDEEHCGSCGAECGFGQACQGGRCVCDPGLADCNGDPADGCETLLASDTRNCGSCGNGCPSGSVCDGRGRCAPTCRTGTTYCDGGCVDVLRDPQHCGRCGEVCPPGETCDGRGWCEPNCQVGHTLCDGECVNVTTDRRHCGACGNPCPGGTVCAAGLCETTCLPSQTECDGVCRDLSNDPSNCGACGRGCGAGELCDGSGNCVLSCPTGLTQCGDACHDVTRDVRSCGACGNACAPGEECVEGICGCPNGGTHCGDAGCVDVDSDSFHCGACGQSCGAEAACASGACDERLLRVIDLGLEGCDTAQAFGPGGPLVDGGALIAHRAPSELTTFAQATLRARDRRAAGPTLLVGDLATEGAWALGDAAGPAAADAAVPTTPAAVSVTHLWPLDLRTGAPTGDPPVALSETIVVPLGAGLFDGWGRAVVVGTDRAFDVDLVTGQVATVTLTGSIAATPCEVGTPYAGVVELLDGGLHITYVSGDDVLRTRLSDGQTMPLLAAADLGGSCALTVSVSASRWVLISSGASRWQVPPGPVLSDGSPRPGPELFPHIVVSCPADVRASGLTCGRPARP